MAIKDAPTKVIDDVGQEYDPTEPPKESSGSVKHFADGFHDGRWEDD